MLNFLITHEDLAKELEMGGSGLCEEDPNFHLSQLIEDEEDDEEGGAQFEYFPDGAQFMVEDVCNNPSQFYSSSDPQFF